MIIEWKAYAYNVASLFAKLLDERFVYKDDEDDISSERGRDHDEDNRHDIGE